MTEIKVVNKYHIGGRATGAPNGVTRVAIYRGTPLGNPFVMKDSSQAERDRVCDAYEEWLKPRLLTPGAQLDYFLSLAEKANDPDCKTLELICFCAPKRCHGDTVAELLRAELA
jgi:hypothetical protein